MVPEWPFIIYRIPIENRLSPNCLVETSRHVSKAQKLKVKYAKRNLSTCVRRMLCNRCETQTIDGVDKCGIEEVIRGRIETGVDVVPKILVKGS